MSEIMDYMRLRVDQLRFNKQGAAFYGYLAGIVDGEGSFAVTVNYKERFLNFTPKLFIGNTDPKLFTKLKECGIESIIDIVKPKEDSKKKPYYRIWLYSKDLRIVLPKIINYLVIKKERAILILDAINLLEEKPTDKRSDRLMQIRKEVMKLNKATVPPPDDWK